MKQTIKNQFLKRVYNLFESSLAPSRQSPSIIHLNRPSPEVLIPSYLQCGGSMITNQRSTHVVMLLFSARRAPRTSSRPRRMAAIAATRPRVAGMSHDDIGVYRSLASCVWDAHQNPASIVEQGQERANLGARHGRIRPARMSCGACYG